MTVPHVGQEMLSFLKTGFDHSLWEIHYFSLSLYITKFVSLRIILLDYILD